MYVENKAVGVMKPGHVFTIEPMICEGKSLIKSQDLDQNSEFAMNLSLLTLRSKSRLSAVVDQAEYISEKEACVMVHSHCTWLLSLGPLHLTCM